MVPVSTDSKGVAVQTNLSITRKDQENDEKEIKDLMDKARVNQVDLKDISQIRVMIDAGILFCLVRLLGNTFRWFNHDKLYDCYMPLAVLSNSVVCLGIKVCQQFGC